MDIHKVKELVKQYPICLICKENGEDMQFNLFEVISEIERLLKEKEWLINGWARTRYVQDGIVKQTIEQEKEFILVDMQQALKGK